MTVVWAGVGLLLGVALGAAAMWLWHRSEERYAEIAQPERTKPTVVEPQVIEVVNLLRSAAMVIGPHDEVLHSNPQARSLLLCRGDRILISRVLDEVRQVRTTEDPVVFDTEVSRGIGAPSLHLNVRVAPLGDTTLLVLADDRTALLRVDETRRDFVANVGHELKTPIGAISLLAEAVESAADDEDAVRRFATRMQGEAARLGELVTQIIDLSRLQADDPMLRAEPVIIGDVINQAVNRSRELATKQAINLVRAGNEQLTVLGDEHQLVDAIANLVQNAIVYSDHGARVVVTTNTVDDDGDDFVEVSVADNGIGISPENQQRIFERFYRVDYGRSRENGGTGLGLSIVKHITAVHGGSVNVWSKQGQGSTFTVRLPLEPAAGSKPHLAENDLEESERVS